MSFWCITVKPNPEGFIELLAQHDVTEPTADERRHAVCMAVAWAPGLIRFAARYTQSIEDAEDAYQRSMELALTSAPVTEPAEFRAWLNTVIRREAATLARLREREEPVTDDDLETTIATTHEHPAGPDAIVEWRERYRGLQDAWTGLTDAQRVCLVLRSTGASRDQIESLTGFSERKVQRSISEGRARLTAWQVRMAAGQECEPIAELIERTIDGTAGGRERRRLSRHVAHCVGCRALYRGQRDQLRLLGSLAPTVLVGSHVMQSSPPDPSFALTWWERVSGSAGTRSAQAAQLMMDIPALATTKAGAGAIAAAAAGVVGTPMVMEAVQADRQTPPDVSRTAIATPVAPPVAVQAPPPKPVPPLRTRTRAAAKSKATVRVATKPRRTVRVTPRPRVTTSARVTPPPRARATARPSRNSSPALEFGP